MKKTYWMIEWVEDGPSHKSKKGTIKRSQLTYTAEQARNRNNNPMSKFKMLYPLWD